MKTTDGTLIFHQDFKQSRKTVWDVMTKPEYMLHWFFIHQFYFTPNGSFETIVNVDSGDRTIPHRWTVLEVIQEKRISYRWRYDDYAGDSTVTFYLQHLPDGCRLTLTVIFLADFNPSIPEFSLESCMDGWTYFIHQSLPHYIKFIRG